jgi:hypothetical protein
VETKSISYRKARPRHDEINIRLAYSTYQNPAEKQCLSTTQQQYPSTYEERRPTRYN